VFDFELTVFRKLNLKGDGNTKWAQNGAVSYLATKSPRVELANGVSSEVLTREHSVVRSYTKKGSNSYLNELSKKSMKMFGCKVLWGVKVNSSEPKPSPEYEVIELSSAPPSRGDNRYYLQHALEESELHDRESKALADLSISTIAHGMHSTQIEDLIKQLELQKEEQLKLEGMVPALTPIADNPEQRSPVEQTTNSGSGDSTNNDSSPERRSPSEQEANGGSNNIEGAPEEESPDDPQVPRPEEERRSEQEGNAVSDNSPGSNEPPDEVPRPEEERPCEQEGNAVSDDSPGRQDGSSNENQSAYFRAPRTSPGSTSTAGSNGANKRTENTNGSPTNSLKNALNRRRKAQTDEQPTSCAIIKYPSGKFEVACCPNSFLVRSRCIYAICMPCQLEISESPSIQKNWKCQYCDVNHKEIHNLKIVRAGDSDQYYFKETTRKKHREKIASGKGDKFCLPEFCSQCGGRIEIPTRKRKRQQQQK